MDTTTIRNLYDSGNEHDACGVGMIVDIHGDKSHELVDSALKILENMKHRGAEGADDKTGDGAGIMLQIPHEFILLQGIPVPEKGKYGTGLIFLPKDAGKQSEIFRIIIEEIEREGLSLMHLRTVPVNSGILGKYARESEPDIRQVFITGHTPGENFERKLYCIRKKIEKRVDDKDFYIVSLSSRIIVYKVCPAQGIFPRPDAAVFHHRHSPRTLKVQHQHLPHMESGAAVQSPRPQRRDKHHTREQGMDGSQGKRARHAGNPRHTGHKADSTAGNERQRVTGQCAGIFHDVRNESSARHGYARTRVLQ